MEKMMGEVGGWDGDNHGDGLESKRKGRVERL